MSAKERAVEIYQLHIALATTDGRLFRKTVMDQLMAETGCSLAAAATHYNNAKKSAPVEGLGRPAVSPNVRKPGATKVNADDNDDDEECFTVIELATRGGNTVVARIQSFSLQGEASEQFDSKVEAWPRSNWVMIKGLGPNSGDTFKLAAGEQEIKRYNPVDAVVA